MSDLSFGIDVNAVGRRLDILFNRYGITTRQMSDALHVTYQCVDKWRKGRSLPEIQNLLIISKLFGISVEELVELNNYPEEKDNFFADIFLTVNRIKKYNALYTNIIKSITLINRVFLINMQFEDGSAGYDNSYLGAVYNVDDDIMNKSASCLHETHFCEKTHISMSDDLYIDIDNFVVFSPGDRRYALYYREMIRNHLVYKIIYSKA